MYAKPVFSDNTMLDISGGPLTERGFFVWLSALEVP